MTDNTRTVAIGGVLLLAASLTGSALKAAKIEVVESIHVPQFLHCDVHVEHLVPAPESRPDVNVPAITGARTVDASHSADAWIAT